MIPDSQFLQHCAAKNGRFLPPELEAWMLVHFEDEPYEDFFDASTLEGLVCLYCDNYAAGEMDVTIEDPLTQLRHRCAAYKDLIFDLKVSLDYLEHTSDRYYRALKEHGLL